MAYQTFINFFWVFLSCVILLIPEASPAGAGLGVAALGISGIVIASRRWWYAHGHLSRRRSLVAFFTLLVCYSAFTVCGLVMAFGHNRMVIFIAPFQLILIAIAIYDAWSLVINLLRHES